MDVIFGLIPMMLLIGFLAVIVFILMAKSGQFDDLDGAANSIFMDDEYEEDLPRDEPSSKQQASSSSVSSAAKDESSNS